MINIDDLVGVKYADNGRSIKTGFDCYGLAIEVCKRFGHTLPDLEVIKCADRDFLDCMAKVLSQVNVSVVDKPQKEGDVILIKGGGSIFNHIGVYLGNGMFIHCNKHGVHLERVKVYEMVIGRVYTWL